MKTKILAVLAVLAMAFAGVAVITETQQNDATGIVGDYQIAAYAVDAKEGSETATDYYGLRAVLYEDKVLMLDTNDVLSGTGKKIVDAGTFKVTLQAPTGASASAVVIQQVPSVNGKIYLDLKDIADADSKPLLAAGNLVITLNAYGSAAVYGNVTMALTATTIAAVNNGLTLMTNHTDGWTDANKPEGTGPGQIDYVDPLTDAGSRNTMICMDDSATGSIFKDPSGLYVLKGWALTFEGDIVIYPAASMSIEEIVYAIADSGANIVFTDTITLYAIYTKSSFALTIQNQADDEDNDNWNFVSEDATLKLGAVVDGDVVAKASVTAEVTGDSFALLRIQQDTTYGQYIYTFTKVEWYDTSGDTAEWKTTNVTDHYKSKMINSGLYQIYDVNADIRFTITATANAVNTSAYNFAVDVIDNKNAATTGGQARLSLDLFDHVATATDTMKMNGTYFRTVSDGVRIYGNLDNIAFTADTNIKGYVDLVKDNTKITAETKTMTLTATNSAFDLIYDIGEGKSIYAAQGVWTQNNVDSDPSTEGVQATLAQTPWSLYKA